MTLFLSVYDACCLRVGAILNDGWCLDMPYFLSVPRGREIYRLCVAVGSGHVRLTGSRSDSEVSFIVSSMCMYVDGKMTYFILTQSCSISGVETSLMSELKRMTFQKEVEMSQVLSSM